MTPTQAIKLAAGAISAPIGQGTSWTVIGPYYTGRADSPYTEARASDYWRARHIARNWRIGHALALLGLADVDDAGDYPTGPSWRDIVYRAAKGA